MAAHHPSSRCRERSRCLRLIVGIDRRVGMPDQIPRRAVPARWDSPLRRELPQRARDEPSRSIGGSGGARVPRQARRKGASASGPTTVRGSVSPLLVMGCSRPMGNGRR